MRDFLDFLSGRFSFGLASSSSLRRWSRSVLLSLIGDEGGVIIGGEDVVLWDASSELVICGGDDDVLWVSSLYCRGCVESLPCVWCMVSCVPSSGVSVISRLRLGFGGHVCVVM